MAMVKIAHGLLEFLMASTFAHPTCKGLRSHAYKFHQQRCCTRRRQLAFTIRTVPVWNKLPTEIVNTSSVNSFKILLDAHCQSQFPFLARPLNLAPISDLCSGVQSQTQGVLQLPGVF